MYSILPQERSKLEHITFCYLGRQYLYIAIDRLFKQNYILIGKTVPNPV